MGNIHCRLVIEGW